MTLINGDVKKHYKDNKKKYLGGGSLGTLGVVVWAFFQLNLSIPALQDVPKMQKQVTILEERIANQKETQAKLTEEVKLLRQALDEASRERATVIAKLSMIVQLQKESRDDIKELMRRP